MTNKKNTFILPDHRQEAKRDLHVQAVQKQFQMSAEYAHLGDGLTACIRTYGCQANVRDGETIAGILREMGFQRTSDMESADFLIFNTCAIRHTAEQHVLGEIGSLKKLKQQNPDKIIALCGCMAQEESVVQNLLDHYPQVDLIFGTHNLDHLPMLLSRALRHQRTVEVCSEEGSVIEGMPEERSRKYKAFVNIMYGCDKFCTYCIVPYTRGKQRSRQMPDIISEIVRFRNGGGREVQLLGQNVNAYGKDIGMEDGFTDLLAAAADTGIERIRFYTSHPRDYSASTIDVMQKYPNIMKSLHLPVQSGSDEILKRMNRGYTSQRYIQLVNDMKAKIPDITLTTDLIVGFPNETDAQFEETLRLVDTCQFDSAFAFVYSPRKGTPAAEMKDDIPSFVKKERLRILNEKLTGYAKKNNDAYADRVVSVLCDGPSKNDPAVLCGYSEENKLVNFTGNGISEGDIIPVKITDVKSYTLDGIAVQDQKIQK
ncbi:MAG: tRNA (N6-isopentenyl adenosine(37)-C2)-methylthiotransferase MiaB [Erysipelotrichia bacterium]|nr:tRNA (N6-isopentenyl adenosine(37)-C2)-methylthiotransferase MiaB [Erysipelotrichia bacterium]